VAKLEPVSGKALAKSRFVGDRRDAEDAALAAVAATRRLT
jgi:hypothetical protein